jgi:hypothetical protein
MTPDTPRPYPENFHNPTDCLTIESKVAPTSNQSHSQVTIHRESTAAATYSRGDDSARERFTSP